MRGEAEGRYERGTSFGCGVAAEKPCIGFIVTNPYLAEVYVRIRTTTCSSDAALIYESVRDKQRLFADASPRDVPSRCRKKKSFRVRPRLRIAGSKRV